MNPAILVVAAIVVIVVVVALAVVRPWERMSPEGRLRSHYGTEYDRLASELGSKDAAEQELRAREERVGAMDLHPVSPDEWGHLDATWRQIQAGFVDDPAAAVDDADGLIAELAKARGYTSDDFEARAADFSVHHPGIIEGYRRAHEMAMGEESAPSRTEDLRCALLDYRDVFRELLGEESEAEQPRPRAVA